MAWVRLGAEEDEFEVETEVVVVLLAVVWFAACEMIVRVLGSSPMEAPPRYG